MTAIMKFSWINVSGFGSGFAASSTLIFLVAVPSSLVFCLDRFVKLGSGLVPSVGKNCLKIMG